MSTGCAGAHEEPVVARAKVDGAVVDGDRVSISTPPIPAVVSICAGVDGDGVITTASADGAVVDSNGICAAIPPPPIVARARACVDGKVVAAPSQFNAGVRNVLAPCHKAP